LERADGDGGSGPALPKAYRFVVGDSADVQII